MPTAPTIAYSIVIGTQTSKEAEVVAAVGEGNLALRDVGRVTPIRIRPSVDFDPASDMTAAHMILDVGLGPGVLNHEVRILGRG